MKSTPSKVVYYSPEEIFELVRKLCDGRSQREIIETCFPGEDYSKLQPRVSDALNGRSLPWAEKILQYYGWNLGGPFYTLNQGEKTDASNTRAAI